MTSEMKDRIGPWLPAIFCATLALIVTICNLWGLRLTGRDGAANLVFIIFMPMCFFFVGAYLSKLRKDNLELRHRLDAVSPPNAG